LVAGTYTASVAVTSAVATNSPQTVSVTFTVALPTPPAAPTLQPINNPSSTRITLNWSDLTNEDGYGIERCMWTGTPPTQCTNFLPLTTVGQNVITYQNNNLTTKTTYSYRMYAHNAGGNSTYSNTVTGTTD
jgi:hypothetical protein